MRNSSTVTESPTRMSSRLAIADGRIAEAWEVYDEAGMWRQLAPNP